MAELDEQMIAPAFKDRKVGLVIFGIIEILFGGLAALVAVLSGVITVAVALSGSGAAAGMSPRMMAPGLIVYGVVAAWFITMGIGSILTRRWARALVLVSSWVWLVSGVSGCAMMLAFMPDIYDQMARNGQLPLEMVTVMKFVMAGFMIIFFAIIPGALVLFYRGKNVKATCEFRDTRVRWTDRCPLPVLAVSLMFVAWACSMALMGVYGFIIPFFGTILAGLPGFVVTLVVLLLSAYVAWGVYKLRMGAWWGAIILFGGYLISMGITFARVPLIQFYEKMGMPEQQLQLMKQMSLPSGATMAVLFGIWYVLAVGYLWWVRKYFTGRLDVKTA